MDTRDFLLEALFVTNALQICQPDNPFWYTSGKIGPYYINTHFLFGGKAAAEDMLRQIETAVAEPNYLYKLLQPAVEGQYRGDSVYKNVIDSVRALASGLDFDIISGGERRDFFFSLELAAKMEKPHLAILKSGETYLAQPGSQVVRQVKSQDLAGLKVLHVADLVTTASSYERAWLPAIRQLGGAIEHTISIVDRNQGGDKILAGHGVKLHSLCRIEDDFFARAYQQELISLRQLHMLKEFSADPDGFMRNFLLSHPDYIDQQLALGGKAAARARLCLEQGYATNDSGSDKNDK